MEKIKPEVVGYSRVYNNGSVSELLVSKLGMKVFTEHCLRFHSSGKPKFRPIYKKEIK